VIKKVTKNRNFFHREKNQRKKMVAISILVEVEVFLLSGESETRIVEVSVTSPNAFISKLLAEVHREFTDNIRLPVGNFKHRIFILNEKEKLIRITTAATVEPLFKWNAIYFDNPSMIQHKFRVCSSFSTIYQLKCYTDLYPKILHDLKAKKG